MGYPRRLLVDRQSSGFYHCISRCVRRAFLCGDPWNHRRAWVESRLDELVEIFAIRSCAYTIMSNHLHLVLRTDPDQARSWTDREVVQRWIRLYPKRLKRLKLQAGSAKEAKRIEERFIDNTVAQVKRVRLWRERLADLSWFNKLLKEPIARRANQEDNCTGHFWEGRFKSHRLLDEAAVLACMVYVDLNPFRAKVATTLKECLFTSILQRIKVIKGGGHRKRRGNRGSAKRRRQRRVRGSLLPIESILSMATKEYVSLVADAGGVAGDNVDHTDRLSALGIDAGRWHEVMMQTARLFGTAIGSTSKLAEEATRRGYQRVVNALDIYRI